MFEEIKIEPPKSETFKFEKVGDFIEGILVSKRDIVTSVGPTKVYNIEKDGVTKTVWGKKSIDDKMAQVNEGDKVKITFKDTKKITGRPLPMKIFIVEVERATAPVNLEDIDFSK